MKKEKANEGRERERESVCINTNQRSCLSLLSKH